MNRTDIPDAFRRSLRARLGVLIESKGVSLTELAERTGRTRTHWYRKLSPPEHYGANGAHDRPLTDSDVDEVLAAIGADVSEILRPVLLAGDADVLRWVAGRSPWPEDAEQVFTGGRKAVERLRAQGLITFDDGEQRARCEVTADGRAALE